MHRLSQGQGALSALLHSWTSLIAVHLPCLGISNIIFPATPVASTIAFACWQACASTSLLAITSHVLSHCALERKWSKSLLLTATVKNLGQLLKFCLPKRVLKKFETPQRPPPKPHPSLVGAAARSGIKSCTGCAAFDRARPFEPSLHSIQK